MIRASTVRFFLVVSPAPVWLRAAWVATLIFGLWTIGLSSRELDSAFGLVLLLQMFAVSTGFSASASRGYFDPLLVSGRRRHAIALGNLAAAAGPGLMVWCALTLAAIAMDGAASTGWSVHRHLGFVAVSCCAWAAGLALPRLAAGAAWSFAIVALALAHDAFSARLLVVESAPDGLAQILAAAGSFVLCPFLLLGNPAATSHLSVLTAVLVAVASVTLTGVIWIARRDYALLEPS